MSGYTPSQTVGPFFHFGLCFASGAALVDDRTPGRIIIEGRVIDGAGAPVPDALLEFWQADAHGRFRSADNAGNADNFDGFGRVATDADGRFSVTTVKPGAVPAPASALGSAAAAAAATATAPRLQAPHIAINVFARGVLTPELTRLYFEDEADANAFDPILALVPASRRDTLIARRIAEARYQFDVVLQGDRETVFFDVR